MIEKELPPSKRPIVLTGVMSGNKTIELDEESLLPDGYRVTLYLSVTPEEAIQLSSGPGPT